MAIFQSTLQMISASLDTIASHSILNCHSNKQPYLAMFTGDLSSISLDLRNRILTYIVSPDTNEQPGITFQELRVNKTSWVHSCPY